MTKTQTQLISAIVVDAGWSDPDSVDVEDYTVFSTAETLANFRSVRARWNKPGSMTESNLGGVPALIFADVAAVKGQPRQDLIVADLGDTRIVIS